MKQFVTIFVLFLLAACTTQPEVTPDTATATYLPTATAAIPATGQPRATETPPAPTETAAPPSPTPVFKAEICSPLGGIAISELATHVSNPYAPPPLGSDLPHQGVDLATFLTESSGVAVKGHPVNAITAGSVASVITDRFPYGNAILVASPLEHFPGLVVPDPLLQPLTSPSLTCPNITPHSFTPEERAVYILYAHMDAPSDMNPGDPVNCGQPLGNIGDSGNVLAPHVHIEIRVGPADTRFASIAHYDTSANPEEMANYCTWRVSGWFQVIDPLEMIANMFSE